MGFFSPFFPDLPSEILEAHSEDAFVAVLVAKLPAIEIPVQIVRSVIEIRIHIRELGLAAAPGNKIRFKVYFETKEICTF